jgi:hypothetical protein
MGKVGKLDQFFGVIPDDIEIGDYPLNKVPAGTSTAAMFK